MESGIGPFAMCIVVAVLILIAIIINCLGSGGFEEEKYWRLLSEAQSKRLGYWDHQPSGSVWVFYAAKDIVRINALETIGLYTVGPEIGGFYRAKGMVGELTPFPAHTRTLAERLEFLNGISGPDGAGEVEGGKVELDTRPIEGDGLQLQDLEMEMLDSFTNNVPVGRSQEAGGAA